MDTTKANTSLILKSNEKKLSSIKANISLRYLLLLAQMNGIHFNQVETFLILYHNFGFYIVSFRPYQNQALKNAYSGQTPRAFSNIFSFLDLLSCFYIYEFQYGGYFMVVWGEAKYDVWDQFQQRALFICFEKERFLLKVLISLCFLLVCLYLLFFWEELNEK